MRDGLIYNYLITKATLITKWPLLFSLFFVFSFKYNLTNGKKEIEINDTINLIKPDLIVLKQALISSLNQYRKSKKLSNFSNSSILDNSSNYHLNAMISKNFFDHINPSDKLYPNLELRVLKFNGNYKCLSENLIKYYPFKIEGNAINYRYKKINNDYLYFDLSGKPLKVLTYKEVTDLIVSNWSKSAVHNINMTNPNYRFVGLAFHIPKYYISAEINAIYVVVNFGGCQL